VAQQALSRRQAGPEPNLGKSGESCQQRNLDRIAQAPIARNALPMMRGSTTFCASVLFLVRHGKVNVHAFKNAVFTLTYEDESTLMRD
jgi:hypothetical protein